MQNRVPLPTDNIFKFYALFGLVLFVFSITSVIYLYKNTNEIIFSSVLEIEKIRAIESPTSYDLAHKDILKFNIDDNRSIREVYTVVLGLLCSLSVFLMYFGFKSWHTKVQPLQDELLQLSIDKLKVDLKISSQSKPFSQR